MCLPRASRLRCAWFLASTLVLFTAAIHGATNEAPTVGMEGRVELLAGGAPLAARPVNEKSPILVRIAEAQPHGSRTRYDLRYLGLVPGNYDLRQQLLRADGSSTADLPEVKVEVRGLLPAAHDGHLIEHATPAPSIFSGYRALIIAAGVAWVVGLVALLRKRRSQRADPRDETPKEPTLAELLQPLVERAAAGQLDTEGKAQLERLLLHHWRENLALGTRPHSEAMALLRYDAEAGKLLRALEDWLHRPPGTVTVDVAALLAPYRAAEAPKAAGGGA